jgi:hypothetical protein
MVPTLAKKKKKKSQHFEEQESTMPDSQEKVQRTRQSLSPCKSFRNTLLLTTKSSSPIDQLAKPDGNFLSAVLKCFFNILTADCHT